MTRGIRLLLVAAACQALLGLAVVATSSSEPTATRATADPPVASESPPDNRSQASPGALPTSASTVPTLRGGAGGPATTTRPTGPTTTLAKGAPLVTTTTTTTAPAATGPKCPNAKTCDIFKVIDKTVGGGPPGETRGWRPDADGAVRIRFFVNPEPPVGSGLTEATMEAAFLEATRIVEAANPRLDYIHQGRTTKTQNQYDGVNVFMFGTTALHRFDRDGYIVESDIGPSAGFTGGGWAYTPCEQRDGGCGDTGTGKDEIMHTIVHEVMHTTGLDDLTSGETRELTMKTGAGSGGDRFRVTLGLGDVLGLRHLYPTSAPMPPIYAP